MAYFRSIKLAPIGLFLLLSGCWWQEMLCNSIMRDEHNDSRMFYDECTAINDPASRGWLHERYIFD